MVLSTVKISLSVRARRERTFEGGGAGRHPFV
jgi:hypothetical protein